MSLVFLKMRFMGMESLCLSRNCHWLATTPGACRSSPSLPRGEGRVQLHKHGLKIKDDLRLPTLAFLFNPQIVESDRLDFSVDRMALRIDRFPMHVCGEVR